MAADGWESTSLREHLYARLKKVAKRLDRPVSWCVGRAVEDYLAKEEQEK